MQQINVLITRDAAIAACLRYAGLLRDIRARIHRDNDPCHSLAHRCCLAHHTLPLAPAASAAVATLRAYVVPLTVAYSQLAMCIPTF